MVTTVAVTRNDDDDSGDSGDSGVHRNARTLSAALSPTTEQRVSRSPAICLPPHSSSSSLSLSHSLSSLSLSHSLSRSRSPDRSVHSLSINPINPIKAKDVYDWTVLDVTDWLRSFGKEFECYVAAFEEKEIDGATLLELKDDGLRELGVNKSLHCSKLNGHIKKLNRQTNRFNSNEMK